MSRRAKGSPNARRPPNATNGARKGNPASNRSGPVADGPTARERARVADIAARRRKERRTLAVVAIALVLVVVGGGLGVQAYRTSRTPEASTQPVGTGFAAVTVTDGKPLVVGRAAAPVTLTLYEDFHCPHCADFEESVGPTVTALQNAGTVKVELYPMAFIDAGSFAAANAMACAAEAGFGQAYYAGLFDNHSLQWSADQLVALGTATDPARGGDGFASCVRDNTHRGWVDTVNTAADANGVSQTPTAFLDGTAVDTTTLTPERLTQLVEEAQKS